MNYLIKAKDFVLGLPWMKVLGIAGAVVAIHALVHPIMGISSGDWALYYTGTAMLQTLSGLAVLLLSNIINFETKEEDD